jgi:hypothetical protein
MIKTYYATRKDIIFFQTNDRELLNRITDNECKEMEDTQDRELGFTVYEKDGDKVFHLYHTWLSSGDGCCHSRSFSPKKERTEYFNEKVR